MLSIYFSIPSSGTPGTNPIVIEGYDTYYPECTCPLGTYTPSLSAGTVELTISCCLGATGNVNYDPQDDVDISDLTTLVNHLFITFAPLACPGEANTSGDASCDVDISDLTALVNHLFVTFEPLAPCDPNCQ